MNFSYRLPAMLIGATVVMVQAQIAVALSPTQVSDIAKEFTVLITGDGIGSGVIFERKGDTYFVITNRHVVFSDGRYEIQTPDGSRYPVYRSQELPGLDLAILQFTSKKNYRIAELGNSDQIREGMTVYVAGWADSLPGIDGRSYQFTDGKIRSRISNPQDGYALVYNNEAIPGMSGGPVLDESARVVGINGRADTEVRKDGTLVASLRLGIPINTLLTAQNRSTGGLPARSQKPSAQPNITTAGQVNRSQQPTTARELSAEDLISLGGGKANRKDYRGAIAAYNQALLISPNNRDAYFRRGLAYLLLKEYRAAIEDYNKVIQLNPKNSIAYYNRGVAYNRLGDKQRAIADYNQTLQINPKYVFAYNNRGLIRYQLGDKQAAIADYDQAIRLDPNYARVHTNRGDARLSLEDKQGALEDFQKAAALFERQGRKNAQTDVLERISKLQAAEANREISPNTKDATVYFNRAIARFNQGNKDRALEDLNQATRINPKYSQAWYSRGYILGELGSKEEALASYDRAIQANTEWGKSNLADAYLERGKMRSQRGNHREAIADFTEVIRLNKPNYIGVAYAFRGLAYQRQGNNQTAIKDFNSAVQIDPNNAIVYFVRGVTYHSQRDYQGAIAAYEKALTQNRKLWQAVSNIGLIKYEQGDVEGAMRQFRRAIDISGKSAEPQLALAVALCSKGDQEQSLTIAESALRLDKRFADQKILKENLWGEKLITDTQKLLQMPKIRELTSRPSRSQ